MSAKFSGSVVGPPCSRTPPSSCKRGAGDADAGAGEGAGNGRAPFRNGCRFWLLLSGIVAGNGRGGELSCEWRSLATIACDETREFPELTGGSATLDDSCDVLASSGMTLKGTIVGGRPV
jgi:hypothetical protein